MPIPLPSSAPGRLLTGALFAASLLPACATTRRAKESLPRAIDTYNQLLRWGKYDSASAFRTDEDRAAFVGRYIAAEDDLHIESMEVRSVTWPPVAEGEPLAANVVVVAQAYLLPSTVLEKIVLTARWEYRDQGWIIARCDRELVPALRDDGRGP